MDSQGRRGWWQLGGWARRGWLIAVAVTASACGEEPEPAQAATALPSSASEPRAEATSSAQQPTVANETGTQAQGPAQGQAPAGNDAATTPASPQSPTAPANEAASNAPSGMPAGAAPAGPNQADNGAASGADPGPDPSGAAEGAAGEGAEEAPGGEEEAVDEPADIPITVQFPGTLEDWCTDQADNFSFFVTSMDALWALSDSAPGDLRGGFGGDFGGLEGADAICQTIAKATGHGDRVWHAFLSATDDGQGSPVHAIDRIGEGPWHDAQGRLISNDLAGLLADDRPAGDEEAVADLVDECGVPLTALGDAHDIVTGSDKEGRLATTEMASTCNDWTSTEVTPAGDLFSGGGLMCGHSFPRMFPDGRTPPSGPGADRFLGLNWMSDHGLRGCEKGANLKQDGAGSGNCIGCSGGYGGLYCFATE